MQLDTTHRLPTKARRLWQLSGVLGAVILSAIAGAPAGFLVYSFQPDPIGPVGWWIAGGLLLCLALLLPLMGAASPILRWHAFRYRIERERLFLQRGMLTIERTLVPLVRVQNVNSSQGPLDRWFKLADVTVATAARTHRIPSLPQAEAEALREGIEQLVRQARDDG